jgi:hypothetical protein
MQNCHFYLDNTLTHHRHNHNQCPQPQHTQPQPRPPPPLMPPMLKVKEKHWGNMEGGDRLNETVIRRRYSRPCDQHPGRRPGVIHVKALAGICAGVQSRMMTGPSRGGEVGNTRGSACSTMTATTTNTTMEMNTTMRRMGRGHAGERTMGGNLTTMVATSSAGRSSAAWGRGC